MWLGKKKSLSTWAKCCDATTTKSCKAGFCSIIHERSQWIIEKITCKVEGLDFHSKTISFMQSHNDQQVVAAPSRTSCFISLLIPHSQIPNICDVLCHEKLWTVYVSLRSNLFRLRSANNEQSLTIKFKLEIRVERGEEGYALYHLHHPP